jgi:hypothetical protein
MSQSNTISQYVHARFREAFGPPHHTMGRDDHWSLRPIPKKAPINVLLNGTLDNAAVWIFDSHDQKDGVVSIAVTQEDQVYAVIEQIQERVKRAAQPSIFDGQK